MGRWEPDGRERLERAALELFLEQGFAETTVPQITARAGLTTRTFFRHFADKREVLFAGEEEVPAMVAAMMAEAPAGLAPMALIEQGLDEVATLRFEGRWAELRARRRVVGSDEGLQERELRKLSVLSEAVERGFRDRGVDELTATLVARLAATVFSVALGRWLDREVEEGLSPLLHDTLQALRSVASEAAGSGAADGAQRPPVSWPPSTPS